MATILIVDDHVLNRQFLMVLLGNGGHRLLEAKDGAEGLELAQRHCPDLVIADILMPNMDGYEFVSRMRSIAQIAETPVIFYTAAYHEREAATMALACGVRWVLPKPSEPALILETVHQALGTPADQLPEPAEPALSPSSERLDGLNRQLNAYLEEVETSRHMMSRLVRDGDREGTDTGHLQQVVDRLSNALSSLQAVSLRLTALIELGIELSTERDPDRLLQIGCRVVQDLTVAKYAGIGILDADGDGLRHWVFRGLDEDAASGVASMNPRLGVFGTALAQRRPLRLSGLEPAARPAGLPAAHPPIRSLLVVPLVSQDKVFGWLYLADKLGAEGFGEVDERAAGTVAAQLAVIYENLSLYGEIRKQHDRLALEVGDRQHAQDALRRTLRARTVMAECNHAMVHAGDEAQLLNGTCAALVEAGRYQAAWISYVDEQDGSQTVVASAGAVPRQVRQNPGAAGPNGNLDSERSWLVIEMGAGDEAPHQELALDHGVSMSLPLRHNGKVFGMLTIHEADSNAFDREHVDMLKGLARDIAFGVTSLRTKAAREKAERDLRATEDKLSSILDSIDNVVWSATDCEFIYINSMVEHIYGRKADEFYADRHLWFHVIHPEDRAAARDAHARLPESGTFSQEYRIVRPDGEIRWIEERARAIRNARGELLRVDGVAIDISKRKAYEARIEFLADHDALTGLANRNLLKDRLTQAMAHARRSGEQVALLFLDLDRFKGVNDSFGHHLGDALLLQVAARLREVVREGDTVARQGGDEFIILLCGVRRVEDVTTVAGKIFDAFSEAFTVEGRDLYVSTSIGITLFPDDADDIQSLLRNADTAMYRAKEEQGNAFHFYSREMSERALERMELESALRRAIERKEFELHYQPKVDARSRRIIGAEALIRWNHPRLGLVSPTRFIPMAEEIGLIVPIGDWVLKTACAQNKAWQQAGLPRICVSVNLSARQFAQEGLVGSVERTLAHIDLAPQDLELELTESVLMNGAGHYENKLRELQDLGVQLSIDDFGTGYSSLSYLKRFPLHHLKIDQSFVRDIANDVDDAAITSTVISLGHSLNLKVIAEGVETEEQVRFLRDHDCDEMQGYYFSRPLPANEFASLLQRT
ncbi:MAG TPA: EAL domain-containing protein [Noviherbaspirillum sp.]|nr:EAL domain-containing protein [Noviherbaspirillum sp.]